MVEGKTLLVLLLLGRCQHPARVPQPAILQCARSAVHPCSNIGTAKQGWLACGAPGIHGGVLAFDGFAQLGPVLHCGAVSSRRGLCLTTRSPHYGYEPQQRSAPGNTHLQNNMTPCFQDGGHVQGQARTMKSIRLCAFMQKREISFSGPLGKHLHSACDARPTRLIKNRLGAASHVFRCGFQFILNGVLWFELAESFILYFLGGVLFYTHYLRWSLFLARFRIIILKEGGQPLDSTTGHKPRATESNLC